MRLIAPWQNDDSYWFKVRHSGHASTTENEQAVGKVGLGVCEWWQC